MQSPIIPRHQHPPSILISRILHLGAQPGWKTVGPETWKTPKNTRPEETEKPKIRRNRKPILRTTRWTRSSPKATRNKEHPNTEATGNRKSEETEKPKNTELRRRRPKTNTKDHTLTTEDQEQSQGNQRPRINRKSEDRE